MLVLSSRKAYSKPLPGEYLEVDWSSALTNGLIALYPFSEGTGRPRDLVKGDRLALNGSGRWGANMVGVGTVLNASDSPGWKLLNVPTRYQISNDVSIGWFGMFLGDGTIANNPPQVAVVYDSANNSPWNCYGFSRDGAGVQSTIKGDWNQAGTYRSLSAASVITNNEKSLWGFTHKANTYVKLYKNGTEIASDATNVSTINYGTDPVLLVGPHTTDNTRNLNGFVSILMIWNRAVTEEEWKALYANPYILLRRTRKRIYADSVAAAGGGAPAPEAGGQPFHRRFWGIPGHAGYSIK